MTTARFDPAGALLLEGTGEPPQTVHLAGPRARVDGAVSRTADGWSVRIPLAVSRWGGPTLALPSGVYDLHLAGDVAAPPSLPETRLADVRARFDGAASTLQVGPPLDPSYDSGEGQEALERRYVALAGSALENAVFFESFYGRSAGCNPLAIDRELARVAPDVVRYWSVVDRSVEVPEGAVAVVEGSPEWWRARGASRLLVVNDWLRRRYTRRAGQRVLQTWHGTPLKRLALHRPGFAPRRMAAVIRESRRWDVLLAQNPYAGRILRKAYAFLRRPVWVEGYPRNDVLVDGDGTEVRTALGIGPDERVLLYAPTWRDDRDKIVDFLEPGELARRADAVVLVRGHSRTMLPGVDASGPRVIDVTAFPDASRLMLAADALVTDYSSIMFDFSVTGKPMYFLVPDMEHYRGELRGFYFDLDAHAPGPVVRTTEELIAALESPDVAERFARRYAAWRERFNARDDGHAAERVVARLLDQGFVQR